MTLIYVYILFYISVINISVLTHSHSTHACMHTLLRMHKTCCLQAGIYLGEMLSINKRLKRLDVSSNRLQGEGATGCFFVFFVSCTFSFAPSHAQLVAPSLCNTWGEIVNSGTKAKSCGLAKYFCQP